MRKNKIKLGIIGGSGLDDPQLLKNFTKIKMETPYGEPSSLITSGLIGDVEVAILARHGKDHSIIPTLVPYRANLWALKECGCTHILATTACGSLQEKMRPGELVFVDQFIDFTRFRKVTFFEDRVLHTPMAEPFSKTLRKLLADVTKKRDYAFHEQGTIITIEGPRFSTKAESKMFRLWGADLINMSTATEVALANELSIPYQAIAMVTDYDCWKEDETSVTFEIIMKRMMDNSEKVKTVLIDSALKMIEI